MMKVYLLYNGRYGNDGFMVNIFKTKKAAVAYIKGNPGFKYKKSDDLYENDEISEWYRIDSRVVVI